MGAGALSRLTIVDPRTGRAEQGPSADDAAAVERAAAGLRAAQPAFEALGVEARARALEGLAVALDAGRGPLARALEADTGRRRVSALEVDSVIGIARRWAARAPAIVAATEVDKRPAVMPGLSYTVAREAWPLVGVISPWNFPLLLALTDALPALAAGSAVLVKPSEVTPRFVEPLRAIVARAGPLADVLAFVAGDGATGAALVGSVDFVCFTGSVATGRKVAVAAASRLIPASLELGGKDPLVVMESADAARAARIALSASCRATGQACQSIERIYVAERLAPAFLQALVAEARTARPNHPDIAAGTLGPFIDRPQALIVQRQIDDALARGARALTGGRVEERGGGLWLMPTVLVEVTHEMEVMREETFGPVLPVMTFRTEEEAVALANDSRFGLSAAVVAGTLAEAERLGRRLEAGAVSLNDGALTALVSDAEKTSRGESGLGPGRMGDEGLLRFLRKKALYRQAAEPLPLAAFGEGG